MLLSEEKLRQIVRKRLLTEIAPLVAGAYVLGGIAMAIVPGLSQWLEDDPSDKSDKIMHWKEDNPDPEGNIFTNFEKTFKDAGYELKLISVDEAKKLAQVLYDGTKGGWTGMGTTLDGDDRIELPFIQIPSIMDAGLIAEYFWKNHAKSLWGIGIGGTSAGGWGKQLTLYEVLQDELTDRDYYKYVKSHLESRSDRESKPFAILKKDGKEIKLYLDQLEDFVKNGKTGGDEDKDTNRSDSDRIDINSLTGSNVEKIEQVLLKYCQKYTLTTPEGFTPDSTWDGKTDELYLLAVNHGFGNHPIFKGLDQAGKFSSAPIGELKWKSIVSIYLVGKGYPGYTGNPAGLLNFLVDMYNGDDVLGKTSSGGSGNRGSSSRTRSREEISGVKSASVASVGAGDVSIRIDGAPEGKTLEDFGGSTKELAKNLIDKLKGQNFSGDTINLSLILNKKGDVVNVRNAAGQRRSSAFENIRIPVLNYFKRINFSSQSKDKRRRFSIRDSVEVIITFPPGRY